MTEKAQSIDLLKQSLEKKCPDLLKACDYSQLYNQLNQGWKIQNARESLAEFIKLAFGTVDPIVEYKHNWHIDLIAEHLEACTRREIKRLIINIPPRMLKSIAASVAWPAWLLGRDPSLRFISGSYAQSLSVRDARRTRLVMQSDWYAQAFPETQLAKDQNEKLYFETTQNGFRKAVSVGSSVIGEGGDFLLVDDPHSPATAESESQRQTALDWYDQAYSTRLNDKKNGVIVVIMQRLHEMDLSGHLLSKGGWEHLCLPMVAEKKTIIDFGRVKVTRNAGDLLFPEREGEKEIEAAKVTLGSYGYAGQYQQRPAPAEGGVFNLSWFRRWREYPNGTIIQSWDTAVKANQHNDPSCCGTFVLHDGKMYLIDVWHGKLEYPELKRTIKAQAEKWVPDVLLIEDKASGQSLIQDLGRETALPIIPIEPEADKVTRAVTQSAFIEAGNLYLPETASWLADFESELMTFPNAAHDDRVDMLTQAIKHVKALAARAAPRVRSF